VSPALAEVAGLAASALATWSLSTASSKERELVITSEAMGHQPLTF